MKKNTESWDRLAVVEALATGRAIASVRASLELLVEEMRLDLVTTPPAVPPGESESVP